MNPTHPTCWPSAFRRKRLAIPAAILLVIIVATASFFAWYHRNQEQIANAAADESHVEIPQDATELSATHDLIRIQGGCSRLSFLLPSLQWRTYVQQYATKPLTASSYGPGRSTCDDIPFDCVEDVRPNRRTGFITKDNIDDGAKYRYLFVIPECKTGQTLISWSTFDL
ncbi:hypothetical protein [Williamsia sp.]|uniref:hypothetical protein n=1 Tax=Williamsia sp. TaxID=1872085 RepID=UPI002F94C002